MTACEHQEFIAGVEVSRLSVDEDGPIMGYSAEVRIRCAHCAEEFEFLTPTVGVLSREATRSFDGKELRVPIRPASAGENFGLNLPGVRLVVRDGR